MTQHAPENVEAAARELARWFGYSFDGIHEGRISDSGDYPQWTFNGIGQKEYQGRKQDLRDMVQKIAGLVNGEFASNP